MVTAAPSGLREHLGLSAPMKFDADPDMARPVSAAELDAAAKVAAIEERERLKVMADVVRAGGTVMPVDSEVAAAQRIGRRELDRRRARRKAAAKARKANR